MKLNPLEVGFASERLIHEVSRDLRETTDYIVISDAGNPGFHYGNYIQLKEHFAPDTKELEGIYRRELPHIVDKYVFTANADIQQDNIRESGLLGGLVASGYSVDAAFCLTATTAVPQHIINGYIIRPIVSDKDWMQATDNQLLCRDYMGSGEFIIRRMATACKIISQKHGVWLGAFDGDRLIADLGLFWNRQKSLARFQMVGTHPDYRQQGIARQLIERAVEDYQSPGLIFVIMASGRPQKIYEKCGFRPISSHVGFIKHI